MIRNAITTGECEKTSKDCDAVLVMIADINVFNNIHVLEVKEKRDNYNHLDLHPSQEKTFSSM